jgi:iron complex outermembrane receptor protein
MKRFISIFLCLTSFVVVPLFSLAQDKEVTLEKVVVTATRDVEEIRKIPANVTVVTKEEIEQSNAQNVVDLLRNEADIEVRDIYGNGKSASVDIRGFGETGPLNTLVLVDGRRVNQIDLSGVDWTQIPLEQVERIEIVRGSGSVLYGDNAAGGVINIITKKPEKLFSARAEVVGGSYGYNKESGSVGGKWGSLSAILNTSHNATYGYRENGFLRANDVGGKVIYDLNENISFNLSGTFHQDDQGLPGALPKAIYEVDRRATIAPDDKAKTDDWYLALGAKAKLWDVGRLEMDLSYRDRNVKDLFRSFSFNDKRNLSTWGVTPRYILEKPLWILPNKLTLGIDFYDSDSNVFSESSFGSNRVEVTKQSTGLYLLDELSLLKSLILSVGYRQEWVTYDLFQDLPRAKAKMSDNEPAWNVSLDYLFDKKSSAFLSVKRSFRFPVSDELIQFFPTFQVNPEMKPQTGYQYEAGVRHAFTDQIEANLTLFWIETRDEIFYNPYTFSNENFPKTRRQGIELGTKVKPLQWLTFWGNYTYIKPSLQAKPYSGNDIPGVPRNKGSVGADVQIGRLLIERLDLRGYLGRICDGLLFSSSVNLVGSQYFISDWANQVDKLGGYYSINAKLSYTWKGLNAFVGVNNITNQKYSEFGVVDATGAQFFYPSPVRNFIGGISYSF